jgi:hypothetical protein
MNRNACAVISSAVVTVCAFAAFYFLSRPLLRLFGISEYAHGPAVVGMLVIFVGCVIVGAVIGFFAFPLVLRPFTSSEEFWGWIGSSRGITFPYLDPLLERWAAFLYGERPHAHRRER